MATKKPAVDKISQLSPIDHRALEIQKSKDRLNRLMAEPEKLMETICDHIAGGGSLIGLANVYLCRYSQLKNWINSDPDRQKMYSQAIDDRKDWAKERLTAEITALSYTNFKQAFNDDGTLKNPHEMPDAVAKLIAGFEVVEYFEKDGKHTTQVGWTKKVKFVDRLKAIELAGKQLGQWLEKHEHSGTVKLEDLIAGATYGDEK